VQARLPRGESGRAKSALPGALQLDLA
jgi:hypothetical protein